MHDDRTYSTVLERAQFSIQLVYLNIILPMFVNPSHSAFCQALIHTVATSHAALIITRVYSVFAIELHAWVMLLLAIKLCMQR